MERFPVVFTANESGSVINVALLILLLLTLMGVGFSQLSFIDIRIAGNDRLQKTALYAADGGTEVGERLVEENLGCMEYGFTPVTGLPYALINNNVRVDNLTFKDDQNVTANFANPDFYFPAANAITDPGTTLVDVGGTVSYATGTDIEQVGGYDGSDPGGVGGVIRFHINSRYNGRSNSQADITAQWRHVIGLELPCSY